MSTNDHALALAVATIERPHAVQRLIRTVRDRFPDLPVYVADQSRRVEPMIGFYEEMGVTLVRMPFDAGVCASRNRLVATIDEPYFVLCDDDFIFALDTDFRDALNILERRADIGIVGGRLIDIHEDSESIRRWELFLTYDPANRLLISTPIDHLAPVVQESGSVRYYFCDAVLNFAVFRKSIFSSTVKWDERFKSNGEHEDFFLNLKMNSIHRVVYLPGMQAYHHHPTEYTRYRLRLRERIGGWRRFMQKWKIDQYLEVGRCVRSIYNPEEEVDCEAVPARFFFNSNLSLRRLNASPDILEVVDLDRIAAVGSLNMRGMPTHEDTSFTRLLIQKGGKRELTTLSPAKLQQPELGRVTPTHNLESRGTVATDFLGRIHIRYDPGVHDESDFVIWYLGEFRPDRDHRGTECRVTLRWFDRHGRVLVWESEARNLHHLNDRYWKPLFVEIPPFRGDWSPLRFEVLEERDQNRIPIATGFVTRLDDGQVPEQSATNNFGWDAMALCHPYSGVQIRGLSSASLPSASFSSSAPCEAHYRIRDVKLIGGLLFLELGDSGSLHDLFFVHWHGLGKSLVQVELGELGRKEPSASDLIVVSDPGKSNTPARLFGYDPVRGLQEITGWRVPTLL